MNLMKHFSGCGSVFGNFHKIFIFPRSETAVWVHFPSYGSLFQLCEVFLASYMPFPSLFMNYMKKNEEGLFNGFFRNWLCFSCLGMNFENGGTSWLFIPSRLDGVIP